MNIDHKLIRKARKEWRKKCDWCGYPNEIRMHKDCPKLPDHHDWEAVSKWHNHPNRPTRGGQSTRVLTAYQKELYEEWKRLKEADISND